jgi:hypothetical protein
MSGTFTLSAEQLQRLAALLAEGVADRLLSSLPIPDRGEPVTLSAESVQALAVEVAELLRADQAAPASNGSHASLVSAEELAREFGVTRQWVYEHRDELGGIRLGAKGSRIRFDPAVARQAINAPTPTRPPAPRRKRRPTAGSILKART